MIYHKSMIAGAIEIAKAEKSDPNLCCVLLCPDGTIVAINRWAIYIAQPALEKIKLLLSFKDDRQLNSPVAVSQEQLAGFIKNIPLDRQFRSMLEHIQILDTERSIDCYYNDGRSGQGHIKLRASKVSPALGEWKKRVQGLRFNFTKGLNDFIYNRKRLVSVVAAFEAACKYDGEFAYVHQYPFDNGVLWQSANELTGQEVNVTWILPRTDSERKESWFDTVRVSKKLNLTFANSRR